MSLRRTARRVLSKARERLHSLSPHARTSYSQEGEDMILRRIFEHQSTGFYVDVGAHHPERFSNTHAFYCQGWSGINIDAMPGSMRAFARIRRRDTNLELGIASEPGALTYFVFNEKALNGFDEALALERDSDNSKFKIIDRIQIQVQRLDAVLGEHLPKGQEIDFLSIDVEGLDFEVLRSNDWSRFRPRFVLAELRRSSLDALLADPISQFMKEQHYRVFAKSVNTVFFERQDESES